MMADRVREGILASTRTTCPQPDGSANLGRGSAQRKQAGRASVNKPGGLAGRASEVTRILACTSGWSDRCDESEPGVHEGIRPILKRSTAARLDAKFRQTRQSGVLAMICSAVDHPA